MYLFGAVCPVRGEIVGYLMPTSDTFCKNLHLAEISRSAAPEVHVVLVLDRAGWHGSKALHVPENIKLVPLPPYSPEPNPMELVWLFIKSHYLANRTYEDHDALYAAGIDGWNRFTQEVEQVRSLCKVAWVQSAKLN